MFYELHKTNQTIQFCEVDGLQFVLTQLGWVPFGQLGYYAQTKGVHSVLIGNSLTVAMEKFWQLEEVKEASKLTDEEKECETSFVQSVSRDSSGRYVVKLSLKNGYEMMLGDSKEIALRRLKQLERKLSCDAQLKSGYGEVLREYCANGYLKEVTSVDSRVVSCYLPHRPVVKESSVSTKIRPVFDGSAKTASGYALNDLLLTGPVIQESVFAIMLRFRMRAIALSADIEKMYLQVQVHPDHTP